MTRAVSVAQLGSSAEGTSNLSFDSGLLFIDVLNNRVGIANTAPGSALTVTGDLATTSNTVTFGTAAYIASNGNVGILNSAPFYRLDINNGVVRSGNVASNTTQSVPMNFAATNLYAGGTGDTNVTGYTFWCNGTYATHIHLRADGYLGAGGWSASAWRWYCNMTNGDFTASGNLAAYSDPRLKEDVKPIESALDKVFKLNGVRFRWKNDSILGHPGQYDYGVLANEVQEVLPELVSDSIAESPDGDRYKTVAYDKLVPVLIEAIKEQQKQIDELRDELRNSKFCSCP